MTTKIQKRSGEFRKSYIEELGASCCIYMTRRSSKIYANHPVTGWELSKVIGKAFIPFALMTNGESCFGGKVVTPMRYIESHPVKNRNFPLILDPPELISWPIDGNLKKPDPERLTSPEARGLAVSFEKGVLDDILRQRVVPYKPEGKVPQASFVAANELFEG